MTEQQRLMAADVATILKKAQIKAHCTQGKNGRDGVGVENSYTYGILVHVAGSERKASRVRNAIKRGLVGSDYIVRPHKEGVLQVIKEVVC